MPSTNNPAARSAVLEYKDKTTGRTPLLLAAFKGHNQILQQLIQLGADVHYINPARDSVGGALHEAAARRHEAAVKLLLGAGACPFVANAAGRTALDEAVLSGHTGVVRAIEAYAEFSGHVAFKIRCMGGLSSKYKTRWAVLMPYYTLSAQGGSSIDATKPRRCLWLYKDMNSVSPRCRLWVNGATVQMSGPAGTEGTLRLHTSHGEPVGDLATTYAHGYCVSLRPSDLTPGAASMYNRLVSLLNGCSFLSGQQQSAAAAAGMVRTPPSQVIPALDLATGSSVSVPNSALFPAFFPPPPPPPSYPAVPPLLAQGGTVSAGFITLNPPPGVHAAPLVVPIAGSGQSLVYPGAAGPCLMASPLSLHQQRQRQQAIAPSSSLAAPRAAPPGGPRLDPESALEIEVVPASPQSQRVRGGEAPAACEAAMGSGVQAVGDRMIEHMTAFPGESDEAFAARLSEAITARSGYSQQTLYPQQDTRSAEPAAVALATPTSPGPANQTQRQSGGPGGRLDTAQPPSGTGVINFHSDPGNGPAVPALGAGVQRPGRPRESLLDELDMDEVNSHIAAEAATASQTGAPPASSVPSTSGGGADAAPSTQFAMAPLICAMQDAVPSAPPADPVTASPARPAPRQQPPEPESECIICMNAPKEVGFLHGDSVHRCVCRECSVHIAVGAPCPLCRQPVERVLGVY